MQRYELYAQIIKDKEGVRRYETMYYPEVPESDNDVYLIAKKGDRLDLIAQRYYNDPRFWIIIAKANNVSQGSLYIPAGVRIRIPADVGIGSLTDFFVNKQL